MTKQTEKWQKAVQETQKITRAIVLNEILEKIFELKEEHYGEAAGLIDLQEYLEKRYHLSKEPLREETEWEARKRCGAPPFDKELAEAGKSEELEERKMHASDMLREKRSENNKDPEDSKR